MADPDRSGLKDVTIHPALRDPWGPTYKGKGHYVSGASGQCRFEVVGPLARTRPPVWRLVVRKLILSWVWAIQMKLRGKHG